MAKIDPEKLVRLQRMAGLSNKDMMDRLSIGAEHLSRLRSGTRNPSDALLTSLAQALGVTPEALAHGSLTPEEHELLEAYRELTPVQRARLLVLATDLAGQENSNAARVASRIRAHMPVRQRRKPKRVASR